MARKSKYFSLNKVKKNQTLKFKKSNQMRANKTSVKCKKKKK